MTMACQPSLTTAMLETNSLWCLTTILVRTLMVRTINKHELLVGLGAHYWSWERLPLMTNEPPRNHLQQQLEISALKWVDGWWLVGTHGLGVARTLEVKGEIFGKIICLKTSSQQEMLLADTKKTTTSGVLWTKHMPSCGASASKL